LYLVLTFVAQSANAEDAVTESATVNQQTKRLPKKKVGVLLGFLGAKYTGMQ